MSKSPLASIPVTIYSRSWIHQLIEEERGTGGNANYYQGVYTYNANGNRETRDVTIGTGSTVHYVYTNDNGDKLTSYTHQVGSGGITTYSYTYDAAGRPTSVPVLGSSNRTLVWDYDSHLKTWSAPGGGAAVMTNVYNGAGTRVSSTVTGGNTQLDLRTDIGQTDALLQSDNSSVSDVNYVPGIAERRGSTWTYDHSGIKNIDSQTNGSQSVTSTRQYDAFGSVVASSGSHAGPFGYGGKFGYQEESAGYKLLGDRWYDPEVGRFLTRDKAHDGRNWYVYCRNNPLIFADPDGHAVIGITGGGQLGLGLSTSLTSGIYVDTDTWDIGFGRSVGAGLGVGGYAGVGVGPYYDPDGKLDEGASRGSAVGIATPVGGWETTRSGRGKYTSHGILIGPGAIAMAYAEERWNDMLIIGNLKKLLSRWKTSFVRIFDR